jgi:hypothetical protein
VPFLTLPLVLAGLFFAMISAVGGLTIVKPVLKDILNIYQDCVPPLVGVSAQSGWWDFSISGVLNHRPQDAVEGWIDRNIFQRAAVVRTFNQALWETTGDTYMGNGSIVSSMEGILYEQSYILVHCGLAFHIHSDGNGRHGRLVLDNTEARSFAQRLRAAQDWFAVRGQTLIYMLGEAKTTWYADRLPAAFPCPEETRDLIYPASVALLEAQRVNLVDGRAVLEQARQRIEANLYPRNGLHWNWLGAALASDALIAEARALGINSLSDLSYEVEMLPDEPLYSYDHDLADLLNLLRPLKGAPSPVLRMHRPTRQPQCTLVAVNDSFFSQPAALLQEAGIFRSIELYRYLSLGRQLLPQQEQPSDPTKPHDYSSIFKADVVVLEEVETRIGGPYALMFLDAVEEEARKQSSVPYARSPDCSIRSSSRTRKSREASLG